MCSRYFYWNIKCTVDVLWRTYWGYYVRSTLFSCYFGNYNWRWIASSITVTIILITRLFLTEYSLASELACYTIVLIGIGVTFIWRMKVSMFTRWIWFNVYSLFILAVPLSMLFKDMSIVALYLACSSVAAYITFISANYVLQSNELFQKMKQYATIDALTGLGNVRQFDLEMNHHIGNKRMKNDSLCLLLIDIDHFKSVNDTYGHPAGDEVLKQIGRILREVSTFPDLAFRKGGEEFALLIPQKGLAYGMRMGNKLAQLLKTFIPIVRWNKNKNYSFSRNFSI